MNLRESKRKNPKWIYEKLKQRISNGFKRIQNRDFQMYLSE